MGNAMSAYDGFKTLIPYFEEAKTNVLIVDYPMFGGSKGNITQKNLYAEADAFYSYLKNDLGFNTINVAGFSIGTGMANYTTATHEVSKLTLAAPYDNFTNVYNSKLNVFYPPISWTTEYKFTSDKFAKSITCPTTIYCVEDDTMVPCRLAISLSKCYAGEVNLIKLEHGGHVSVVLNEDFIKEVLSIEKNPQ